MSEQIVITKHNSSATVRKSQAVSRSRSYHSWRLDLAALLLFFCGLVIALSLISHQFRTDSARAIGGHLIEQIGANLIHGFGLAAYLVLGAWFVLVVSLFMQQHRLRWARRLTGCLLLIPCAAGLAEASAEALQSYFSQSIPLTGPGGTFGTWLHLKLASLFGSSLVHGALQVTAALALLMIFDRYLIRALVRIGMCVGWVLIGMGKLLVQWWNEEGEDQATVAPAQKITRSTAPPIEAHDEEADMVSEELPSEEEMEDSSADLKMIPINHHDRVSRLISGKKKGWSFLPLLKKSAKKDESSTVPLPEVDLLDEPEPYSHNDQDEVLLERAELLEKTYRDFGLNIKVVGINTGPVITQYEIALEKGIRVHKVTSLADDVALNLRVPNVRMVAPIPGKSTVGIETPNEERALVRLKEVMLAAGEKSEKYKLPLFLGKDAEGRPLVSDLAEMPHLLIAGRTGTGKSVCMNSIILSMLMTRRPDEVQMIMIDPKMLEMSEYGNIPHLMHPVVKDMKKAEAILSWAVDKMEERYDLLSRARVRSIAEYNKLSYEQILKRVKPLDEEEEENVPERMPYIVIFVDEMADLMMMMKKEVEGHIIRLAQKSRAAGIHLVVATQKPTVDVITGLIKSNLPARICFKVVNKSDSRVVLDEMGADKLLGKGDMLFLPPNGSEVVRAQGTYLDNEEITRVVSHLEQYPPCYAEELLHLSSASRKLDMLQSLRDRDDLYESAIEVVVREQRGSVSLLQRSLGIGYGRAARLIDFMAEDGIVGPYNGSSAREVLHTPESWEGIKTGTAS